MHTCTHTRTHKWAFSLSCRSFKLTQIPHGNWCWEWPLLNQTLSCTHTCTHTNKPLLYPAGYINSLPAWLNELKTLILWPLLKMLGLELYFLVYEERGRGIELVIALKTMKHNNIKQNHMEDYKETDSSPSSVFYLYSKLHSSPNAWIGSAVSKSYITHPHTLSLHLSLFLCLSTSLSWSQVSLAVLCIVITVTLP